MGDPRSYTRLVRSVGGAERATGLGLQDHLCWPYLDRADFRRRVCEFFDDGFGLGLRCVFAAEGPLELLKADLAGLPDLHSRITRGDLVLTVLGDLYPEGAAIDPGEALSTFAAATEGALADGFAGLRVAADATSLVRSPEQLAAFASWEHTADRYMSEHPLSALCGFDQRKLTHAATTALASLHPAARAGVTPFQVYCSNHGADLSLAGELDITATGDFRACLDRIELDRTGELVVDGTGLDFVDHRGLVSIRDFASRLGATAVFRTCSETPGRVIALLGLEGIRAEPAPAEGVLT